MQPSALNLKDNDLLLIEDAASKLGVSKSTLRRLVEQGLVGFYKVGRGIRFSIRDLEKYLEKTHVAAQ